MKGYEGLYRVSNYGQVYSIIRNRLLNPFLNKCGYCMVRLHKQDGGTLTRVHRIVGNHFLSNMHNKPFINHIDLDKTNNKVNNLEWVTPMENNTHYKALTNTLSIS